MTAAPDDVYPPPDGWTTDDLDALPEDGRRRELLDGVLILSPSPTAFHQIIAGRLMVALETGCPSTFSVTQGVEVRINGRRSFIPDVLVVTDDAAARFPARFEPHEVMLAVEIVSKTSVSMDRITKPALYAQVGIPYYWRIEVEDGLTVHTYKIDPVDEVYYGLGEFTDVIDVSQPWPIKLPVSRLTPKHLPPAR
jgi:Uma2 family endonuclease